MTIRNARQFSALIVTRFVLLATTFLIPAQNVLGEEILKPKESQSVAAPVIAKLLRQYHYNHQKIDDDLSSETLDLYIDGLDRSRMYFLASDIADFEKYRYRLDDLIFAGNMEPIFLMFNTWKERVEQRIEFVNRHLETEFDFTIHEDYELDRSDAKWARTVNELDAVWRKRVKNEALSLKLAGQDWESIQSKLKKRYENRLRNIHQYHSEDVFQF